MRTLTKIVVWVIGIVVVVCGVLYLTAFDVWTVPSDDPQLAVSIEPELSAGDTVLVWRGANPDLGTLARCSDPDQPGKFVIGRVIGQAGDALDIHNGIYLYNGKSISSPMGCDPPKVTLRNPVTQEDEELSCSYEEFAGTTHPAIRMGEETKKVDAVESGKVFLLSDNRPMHLDSRDFGQVSSQSCQRIAFRLWGSGGYFDAKRRFTMVW